MGKDAGRYLKSGVPDCILCRTQSARPAGACVTDALWVLHIETEKNTVKAAGEYGALKVGRRISSGFMSPPVSIDYIMLIVQKLSVITAFLAEFTGGHSCFLFKSP